jgi:hypothetical protein
VIHAVLASLTVFDAELSCLSTGPRNTGSAALSSSWVDCMWCEAAAAAGLKTLQERCVDLTHWLACQLQQ